MIKKISHIVLTLLLLISAMGVAISKHYCSGTLVSTSFFTEANSCCGDSDCCSNENNVYKVDEDYSIVSIAEIPTISEFDLIGFELMLHPANEIQNVNEPDFIVKESPPPKSIQIALSKKQLYLL